MAAPYSPSTAFRSGRWLGTALACTLVLVLAMLPPFVGPGWREALLHGFHGVCHQMPGRSFQVDGVPFALCHRCFGIATGLVLGVGAFPFLRWMRMPRPAAVLFVTALPMTVDWALGASGLWANTPVSRVLTGAVFGLAAGWVLARAVVSSPSPEPPPLQPSLVS
ncbi:MAG: DUF2085 domain-containing protein [Rhodothermaceae bacterium]|nr:DUF2085 domain-containing protein [Rhodothermaceae bacterium]